jgi:hypothetical protein
LLREGSAASESNRVSVVSLFTPPLSRSPALLDDLSSILYANQAGKPVPSGILRFAIHFVHIRRRIIIAFLVSWQFPHLDSRTSRVEDLTLSGDSYNPASLFCLWWVIRPIGRSSSAQAICLRTQTAPSQAPDAHHIPDLGGPIMSIAEVASLVSGPYSRSIQGCHRAISISNTPKTRLARRYR